MNLQLSLILAYPNQPIFHYCLDYSFPFSLSLLQPFSLLVALQFLSLVQFLNKLRELTNSSPLLFFPIHDRWQEIRSLELGLLLVMTLNASGHVGNCDVLSETIICTGLTD